MKTAPHHYEGKKCLIEIYNNKTKESDFVRGYIVSLVSSTDSEYRINAKTEDGIEFRECHPDCILPYWYISARSAWDTVLIGPFKSKAEAERNYDITWTKGLIKEA